jgi:hypothetical protein
MIVLVLLDMVEFKRLRTDLLNTLVLPIAVTFIFWLIYGLVKSGEYGPLALLHSGGHVESLIEVIFNKIPGELQLVSNLLNLFLVLFYPITGLVGFLHRWLMVYPLITSASVATVVFNLYFLISKANEKYHGFRFLMAIFILCIMMVSILTIGTNTRFTFFLYPILLLLTIGSIKQLSDKFLRGGLTAATATLCIFILIFMMSKDFNLNHILNIDSAKINFRQEYNTRLTSHYIMRRDYKGVAEFIEAQAKDDDLVISAHQTLHYYTRKVNYILFGNKNQRQFPNYTACKGKKERWTNADLIYKTEQLFDLIEHSKNDIWIVVNISNPKYARYDEAEVIKRYKDKLFFTAQDGILGVFKLEKAAVNAQIDSRD